MREKGKCQAKAKDKKDDEGGGIGSAMEKIRYRRDKLMQADLSRYPCAADGSGVMAHPLLEIRLDRNSASMEIIKENRKPYMEEGKEKRKSSRELADEAMDSGELPKGAGVRYVVSVLIMAVSVSFGNILLKYRLSHSEFPRMRSFGDFYRAVVNALSNPWIDLGIILLITNLIVLGYALRYGPVSLTTPLRSASAFIGTSVLAVVLFGEHVNLMHWVAILMITAGTILLGVSGEKGR